MFWDWVSRVIFRRSRRRSMRELDVMTAEMEERMRHLNARIAKLYTKEEWAALENRIRREHPYLFDDHGTRER